MTKIEYLPLNDVEVASVNPKDHDIGEIYTSIKRWGFIEPIVRNEKTGKLVAGHVLGVSRRPHEWRVIAFSKSLVNGERGLRRTKKHDATVGFRCKNRLTLSDKLQQLLAHEICAGIGWDLHVIKDN